MTAIRDIKIVNRRVPTGAFVPLLILSTDALLQLMFFAWFASPVFLVGFCILMSWTILLPLHALLRWRGRNGFFGFTRGAYTNHDCTVQIRSWDLEVVSLKEAIAKK